MASPSQRPLDWNVMYHRSPDLSLGDLEAILLLENFADFHYRKMEFDEWRLCERAALHLRQSRGWYGEREPLMNQFIDSTILFVDVLLWRRVVRPLPWNFPNLNDEIAGLDNR